MRWNAFFYGFMALVTITFLPKLFFSDTSLYTDLLTLRVLLFIGSPVKLLFLMLGFVFSIRCLKYFDTGNPVRASWLFLGFGFFFFFAGQLILSWYQLVLFISTPYPSQADLFFIIGTICMIISLTRFIFAYRSVGYPVGTARQISTVIAILTVLFGIFGYFILQPIAEQSRPGLELILNTAYPILDFILLFPTVILFLATLSFRGGEIWKIWMSILTGFIYFSAGDILFAYMTLGFDFLDPLVDLMFIFGYILGARGCYYQYNMLTK